MELVANLSIQVNEQIKKMHKHSTSNKQFLQIQQAVNDTIASLANRNIRKQEYGTLTLAACTEQYNSRNKILRWQKHIATVAHDRLAELTKKRDGRVRIMVQPGMHTRLNAWYLSGESRPYPPDSKCIHGIVRC